jgi:hypothetical protein
MRCVCLPFDCAQDKRQHGTCHLLVCSFSARSAEKLHTIEKEYTALPKAKAANGGCPVT